MLFFVVLAIGLGWAGWVWAWGRDRYVSQSGLGYAPNPFAAPAPSFLGSPLTNADARRRRREVLAGLGSLWIVSFLIARAWGPMWVVTVAITIAAIAYAIAVYRLEAPEASQPISFQQRFAPVPDPSVTRLSPYEVVEQARQREAS